MSIERCSPNSLNGKINVPSSIGSVVVRPGDAADIAAKARKKHAANGEKIASIKAGTLTADWIGNIGN